MSGDGPDAGQIIAGVFLLLFGICVTLVGGGCTILMIGALADPSSGMIPLFLVSLAVLAGGLVSIWAGIKLMSGRVR